MKMRLIAIAAIALSPAVVLGQSRTHIKVSKDGTHSTTTQQSTNGDVYTAPAPAPAPAAEPAPAPAPAPADTATPPAASTTTTTTDSTAAKTDSTQMGTGAAAPTPTHSMQTDSTAMSDSTMRTDSTTSATTTTPVDTVRVPRSNLNVSPVDSARIGIPATRQTQQADSARHAADSTATTTPPPR